MIQLNVERIVRTSILQNKHYKLLNSWKPLTKKLIQYNNKLVDDYIIHDADINIQTVNNNVTTLFEPAVLKSYQQILKSPLVNSSYTNKIWLEGQAKQITDMIGVEYTERISKNIEAIQQVLQEVEVNISKYEKMIQEFPTASRLHTVEKALEKGENWKGHTYSYKELENMNRGITKYVDNRAELDKYTLNYNEATNNGETPEKSEKEWIWSGLENTRHREMDGETVHLTDSFNVINELTGDEDKLMFPGDFDNDRNNCSNICNCSCDVVYL